MECTHDELGFLKDYLIQNVQVEDMIDKGAYGRIMEAKWEGTVVAIKEIHGIFNDVSEEQFQALKTKFLNECKKSSQLRHPNIVRFLGIYFPTGARVPCLVMERLHSNLAKLLERDPIISLESKLSILHQISLGLRYLHTRTPPVIHRDLSSNNILISRGMEAKITDFGTVRILEPNQQTPMSLAPGTIDFMPPEALVTDQPIKYKEKIDIFSFGCVMLHTFSHAWPYPSQSVIVDPVSRELIPRSEIQRRDKYLKVPKEVAEIIVPLIRRCLENHVDSRPSAEKVCVQLKPLVINQPAENYGLRSVETNDLQMQLIQSQTKVAQKCAEIDDLQIQLAQCQAEVEEKCAEVNNLLIQLLQSQDKVDRKTVEINSLQARLALVNKASSCIQIGMNSVDFWRSLNPVWTRCADLLEPYWITSVAELDGNVYVTPLLNEGGLPYPLKYDSNTNRWSRLPDLLSIQFTLVAIPGLKQLLAIGGLSGDNLYSELAPSDKVFVWDGMRWTAPYPNMPTARFQSSAVCYQSMIIVAGGVIRNGPPRVMTRAVEVLNIGTNFSYWSKVEELPYISNQPSCLLIDDMLYITVGFNKLHQNQTDIAVASLPALLQSHPYAYSSGGQIWGKLPDLPYPSPSINVVQKRLITFGGIRLVEQPNKKPPKWQLVPLVHIYNHDTKSWDCVGKMDHRYYLGRSVHIGEDEILFIGGTIGKYITDSNDDLVKRCSLLTITHKRL